VYTVTRLDDRFRYPNQDLTFSYKQSQLLIRSYFSEKPNLNRILITISFIKTLKFLLLLNLADKGWNLPVAPKTAQAEKSITTHAVLLLSSIGLPRPPGDVVVHGRPVCPHPCSLQRIIYTVTRLDDKPRYNPYQGLTFSYKQSQLLIRSYFSEKPNLNRILVTISFIKTLKFLLLLNLADKGGNLSVAPITAQTEKSITTHAVLLLSSIWLPRPPGDVVVHGRPVCPHPCSLQRIIYTVTRLDDKPRYNPYQDLTFSYKQSQLLIRSYFSEKPNLNRILITISFIKTLKFLLLLNLADKGGNLPVAPITAQTEKHVTAHAVLLLSSVWLPRPPGYVVVHRGAVCPHPCSLQRIIYTVTQGSTTDFDIQTRI
jgi:hypothetical protein